MTSIVRYTGGLRTAATHQQSGSILETDAPADNHGKGERFSPTDLIATALASCICTIMGIVADKKGWNIVGASCAVTKIMAEDPRRIGRIEIIITMPDTAPADAAARKTLEHAAHTCPVFESLHPACENAVSFVWPSLQDA